MTNSEQYDNMLIFIALYSGTGSMNELLPFLPFKFLHMYSTKQGS